VKGHQGALEEIFVLGLDGDAEPMDNRAENLQQFGDAVEVLRLVDEAIKEVADCAPDEGAVRPEACVDAMQGALEVVTFTRVLRVE